MTTQLNLGRDSQGYNAYAPQFAVDNQSATLATATDTTYTVSGSYTNYIAVFSYEPGSRVWVANNHTAAVPVGGTFASTNSVLNPAARKVVQGDVLHFITPDTTADVSIALYGIF